VGTARAIAKRCLYTALGSAPIVARRLSAIERAGKVTILNLHRVAEADHSEYKPLQPRLFVELLDFLERHFTIVPLAALGEKTAKPKAGLSFDDGYKDFVEVAAPILDKRKITVNLNVIPGAIERQLPPFNVLAQDFVGKAPRELVDRLELPGFTSFSGPNLGPRLSAFLKNRPRDEQARIEEALVPQFFAWAEFRPTPMLSEEEVRQVAQHHEVGGHSYDHATMGFETDEYFEADLSRCRAYFENRLGQPMTVYAFPNGSCRDRQIETALSSGIEHVLLVGEDFSDGGQLHKRFTFGARSPSEVRFRAVGAMRKIA
jgi:peptidoglycan/xylan/chitin deacetylase (PgdA/CDA1 family)